MSNNDNSLYDERAQKAQSLLQTIQAVLPGLTASLPRSSSDPAAAPDDEDSLPDCARTGKVARLPAATRETVNLMLNDNVPYPAIVEKLSALGHPGFTPCNISRWKKGGYVEWLHHRYQAEAVQNAAKTNLQLLKELSSEEQESLHKIIELTFANHILSAFAHFNPSNMHSSSAADILSTFGHTISRHLRERTRYERLRLAVRRFEMAHADTKNPPATGAIQRNLPQSTATTAPEAREDGCPEHPANISEAVQSPSNSPELQRESPNPPRHPLPPHETSASDEYGRVRSPKSFVRSLSANGSPFSPSGGEGWGEEAVPVHGKGKPPKI